MVASRRITNDLQFFICASAFASVIEHGQAVAFSIFSLEQPSEAVHFALAFRIGLRNVAERPPQAVRLSSATLSARRKKGSPASLRRGSRSAWGLLVQASCRLIGNRGQQVASPRFSDCTVLLREFPS